jgi:hypothetical protein
MTAESQPIEGAEQRPGLRHGLLVSRRRLAKAGLASPVVLGSLMSKPVLGADPLYHCTPSGQQSGNLSRTSTVSCKIGISPAAWAAIDSVWPSPAVRGTDPNGGCNFAAQGQGTLFDGFTAGGRTLLATFGSDSGGGTCSVVTSGYSGPATMLQVLKSPFSLGQETVAAILNALRYGSGFPVTVGRVIEMFNAIRSTGTYMVNSKSWSATDVQTYFASLHGL